ncbi:MAG: dihydroorotase family protein, partial [Candidatus Bathyarchaeia archaeon]
ISTYAKMPKAERKINLEKLLVLPGLIDAHVHLRDEGKSYKEDFYSGTAAAAAGGFTTVLDMPNNDPVTMSAKTMRNRMETAENKILVNVGFYSEFPKKLKEIPEIVAEGPVGFKLFLAEQIGGLNIDDDIAVIEAFKTISQFGVTVAVHAEDKTMLEKSKEKLLKAQRNDVRAFLEAHSENVERVAVERVLKIAQQTNAHTHICHVSSKDALQEIRKAKEKRGSVTCEATPHHLLLTEDFLNKIGTLAITMPPVRSQSHAEALWLGIKKRWIDVIGSDHAPHTLAEKKAANVWEAKVGVPGLETTLPLLLTAVKQKRLALSELLRLTAENPAKIFGLKKKGSLKVGNSADLAVVSLKRKFKIDSSAFYSRAKFSPFDGWKVEGKAVKTFVNGQLVMDEGSIVGKPGTGKIIRRKHS